MHTKLRTLTLVTCSVLALGACSEDTSDRVDFPGNSGIATNASGEVVTTGPQIGQNALELDDGVIYAKPAADAEGGSEETPIYGTLRNTTTTDIEITGFTTSLGTAAEYEIHETADGEMREREESILIPAGESHEFKEGGDHLMIVGYGQELPDGSTLDITFDIVPQQKVAVSGVPVRKQP